jgi:hypothetical protein
MMDYETLAFTDEDVPGDDGINGVLRSARLSGAALREMRDKAGYLPEAVAHLLGLSVNDLLRAEAGQLIEVTRRGQLIDMSSTLLVPLALAIGMDYVYVSFER